MNKKYIALFDLYHMNGVQYIKRGKLYAENEYLFAKTISENDSGLKFKTKDGKIIILSNNSNDEWYYEKLFRLHETVRY